MSQVAGINYLHNIGIIHRDIKPDNVLIDWRRNLRITDLGLAFISERREPLDPEQKYAYLSLGTQGYMAPEVQAASPVAYLNNHAADPQERQQEKAIYGPKADYYSLGMLLYELATLRESSVGCLSVSGNIALTVILDIGFSGRRDEGLPIRTYAGQEKGIASRILQLSGSTRDRRGQSRSALRSMSRLNHSIRYSTNLSAASYH